MRGLVAIGLKTPPLNFCLPPTLCLFPVMAALSTGLIAVLTSSNCSNDKFRAWLGENEIISPDGLGLLAATEQNLEDKVFPMLQAAGIPMTNMAVMISIKKAWHLSRSQVEKEHATMAGKQPAPADNEPLSAPTRNSLTDEWTKRHGHTLSNDRLLTENLIGQLHRELHAAPRRLGIHLAESLRLQSSIVVSTKKFATVVEGYIATEEHIADQVQSILELYTRIRAFFGTMAFISIHDGAFFTLQDAIFIEDKLLNLLQFSKDGKRPPIVFFTTAWATLMQLWSDELRTSGKTLATLCHETASWTPMWTSWSPPTAGSHEDWSQVPSTGGGSAKERDLQAEFTKTRRWAAQMQSERDHVKNGNKHQDRPRSRSRAGGKGRGDSRRDDRTDRNVDHAQHEINRTARAKGAARKGGKKGSRR